MAVLQKLRGWGIVLSILVALPLLLFILDPSQIQNALQSVSSKYDVGVINGKSVSYTAFQNDIDYYTRLNELMTGSSSLNEQQQAEIRNAAWQALLDKYLFIETAREAGINVGNAEIIDLTSGESVSPLIAQNPVFAGEDGTFSKDALMNFLSGMDNDESGSVSFYWNYLQNAIVTSQYYNKYNALFAASNFQNALMTRKAIEENNTTSDIEYVMVPHGYANDSTIVVSDSEIKAFYNSHKDFFKQKASRDIEYVVYQVKPSSKDLDEESDRFTMLYDEFASTDNLRAFLQRNSDTQYSDYYYKAGELSSVNADVEKFVAANTTGTSPIISSGNNFYAARIIETAQLPDSAYVRHILLRGADADAQADSLLGVLRKGGDFATLATLHSADQNSAADGKAGNIGWLTQNMMIPGFEGVFSAKAGAPYVINTQYGTHVVEVTRFTKPVLKKKVAIFQKETLPSQETFNEYYNLANRFATLATGSTKNFHAAVDSMAKVQNAIAGTYSHPLTISEDTESYGAIGHAKEVTRWAFDNKPGKVSNIITVDNNYFFIATVKAAHKEGYATVEEAAPVIKNQLYQEKYAENRAAEVAAKIKGLDSMEAVAEALGTSVSTQSGVAFGARASYSMEPKFVGAVAAAPQGAVCGPVAGSIASYVFKVTSRDNGSFYTEEDAKSAYSQMAAYASQMLVSVMADDADVKDNRARFF